MSVANDNAAKTFVVTGATSGIGLALAHALARTAGRLVIVGRDERRLRSAVAEVQGQARRGLELVPVLADLATVAGSDSLAERLVALPRIDVLVHNAGILPGSRTLTIDGFEESFAVNHLAPFVLNRELRERLVASAPARIVQVSAGLALGARVDPEGDPRGARFDPVSTYAATKLWNLLATLHLAADLQETGVTVNAVHPGVVRTRLGEGAPGLPGPEVRRRFLSPEDGARGPLRLATAPELARTTGRFFNEVEERPIHVPADWVGDVVRTTRELLGQRA